MAERASSVRQSNRAPILRKGDLKRAIAEATEATGLEVVGVRIGRDGEIQLTLARPGAEPEPEGSEWRKRIEAFT